MTTTTPSAEDLKTIPQEGDLVIVNDFDRPCTRLIARVVAITPGGHARFEFVSLRHSSGEPRYAEGPIEYATLVSDFHNGVATYRDGDPRRWDEEK